MKSKDIVFVDKTPRGYNWGFESFMRYLQHLAKINFWSNVYGYACEVCDNESLDSGVCAQCIIRGKHNVMQNKHTILNQQMYALQVGWYRHVGKRRQDQAKLFEFLVSIGIKKVGAREWKVFANTPEPKSKGGLGK